VLRYHLDVGSDHFSFISTRPALDDGIQENTSSSPPTCCSAW
jgi:hypothetical protein